MLEMKTKTNKGGQNVRNENKNKVDRMLEMKTKTRWSECQK